MAKVEQTRQKILTAGLKLIRKKGIAATSLTDVAESAAVTRQTIYFHFGSRAGLLVEILRRQDVTSPRGQAILATTRLAPDADALAAFVRAWFAYLPEIFLVARELQYLAAADPEVRESWRNRQNALKAMASVILRGLKEQGMLRPGWDVDEAAEWVCAQLFPSQWQGLVGDRKWPPRRFVERTVESVCGTLCTGSTRTA
jgi:AcrR family transcriptional regulator